MSYSTNIKQKKLKDEVPSKDRKKSMADANRKKSLGNTSGASILYAGRMSSKDRRLLKMILVIFISFLTCYLPITLTKVSSSIAGVNFVFIMGYLLVYLTTCINPIIYVVMSSEYRQAYKNLLMCRTNNSRGCNAVNAKSIRRQTWPSSSLKATTTTTNTTSNVKWNFNVSREWHQLCPFIVRNCVWTQTNSKLAKLYENT